MKQNKITAIVRKVFVSSPVLTAGLILSVTGAVILSLVPPLILEKIVNELAENAQVGLAAAMIYFLTLFASSAFEALKELAITIFGQRMTRRIRHEMCAKLDRLPARYFSSHEPGTTVSRFVNDVDTVEELFTSGIIGMFADACKVVSILAVIFIKSKGLGILMAVTAPVLFAFTRIVQKRMLVAQKENRKAVGRVTGQIPETIQNIRMIHVFGREGFMEKKYDERIEQSYNAIDKTNFYDAVYSPVILIISAVIIAVMMIFAAQGGTAAGFFGMSVGTSVAIIAYVSQVFGPIESIGMEIQSIQSAIAGVSRIREFLNEQERMPADKSVKAEDILKRAAVPGAAAIEFSDVCFEYDTDRPVLTDLSFCVKNGENVTLAGRTGAGKSTAFKLLLGFYQPQSGSVRIFGIDADKIPDDQKRRIFGVVEQSFRPVPGTVRDQISVYNESITQHMIENAAELAGIHQTIINLPQGYATPYSDSVFSQGQRQLLAVARAVAADPAILLLDEITANLDAETENQILQALRRASEKRTVLSVSHRLYETVRSRLITIAIL